MNLRDGGVVGGAVHGDLCDDGVDHCGKYTHHGLESAPASGHGDFDVGTNDGQRIAQFV